MLPYVAAGTFCGNETLVGALRNYTDLDQLCCLSFGDVSRLVFLDGSNAYPEDSTR